jgi:hypothetical protein
MQDGMKCSRCKRLVRRTVLLSRQFFVDALIDDQPLWSKRVPADKQRDGKHRNNHPLFHFRISAYLAILVFRCFISVVEDTAFVIGVVQLCTVGSYIPAGAQKNLSGGQHAQCRRSEIDPQREPVAGMKC